MGRLTKVYAGIALLLVVSSVQAGDAPTGELRIVSLGHAGHGMESLTAAIVARQASKQLAKPLPLDAITKGKPSPNATGSLRLRTADVRYQSGARKYLHVQCCERTDYLKALIAGPGRFDGAILVVSAADGPMPGTKEHVGLAKKTGIPAIVVFLDNCNLVDDPDLLELVELEICDLLAEFGYPGDDVPVVRGSSRLALETPNDPAKVKCIDELLAAIDKHIPDPKPVLRKGAVASKFETVIYVTTAEEGGSGVPLASAAAVTFLFGAKATPGRMHSVDSETFKPGTQVTMNAELDQAVRLEKGSRFVLRQADRRVAVGMVTEIP